LLAVSASELSSGVEASITVKPAYGLSDDEIAGMLKDSMAHSRDDALKRALKETQVEAQRLIEAVVSAIRGDGDLLSEEQRVKLESCIAGLQATVLGDNRRHITLAMDDLEAETKDFAARRMNRSIHNAFAGKSIKDLEGGQDSSKSLGEPA